MDQLMAGAIKIIVWANRDKAIIFLPNVVIKEVQLTHVLAPVTPHLVGEIPGLEDAHSSPGVPFTNMD